MTKRFIYKILLCLLFLCWWGTVHAEAATITRTSAPFFSFDIYTPVEITDGWAKIDSFAGQITLGDNAPDSYHIGPMAAGSTTTVFFYIKTTATGDVSSPPGSMSIGHDISLWDGNPSTGGTEESRDSFYFNDTTVAGTTYQAIEDTIESQASKVSSVVSGPTPATLGGIITFTITGSTGSTNGPISFTPASTIDWPAQTFKLVNTSISLPNGMTLSNQLYYDGNPGSGNFVGTYQFIAISSYTTPTATSPAQYINSGNTMKHVPTDEASIGGFIPIVPSTGSNSLVAAISCTPNIVAPGAPSDVDCTITFTNSGSSSVDLDSITTILPTTPGSVSYTTSSSAYNGSAINDPFQSGSTLTWSSLFQVPAGASRSLIFSATIPDTEGNYLFTAYGLIGSTQIDTTTAIDDDAPATCIVAMTNSTTLAKAFSPVTIGPTVGATVQSSQLVFTINNPAGTPAITDIAFTDTLPSGLTWTGIPTTPQCGGTVTYSSGAEDNIIEFTGGSLGAGPASCTITVEVNSTTPGLYLNNSSNISGQPAWLNVSGVSATLQVAPAALTKSFSSSAILENGTVALNFVVSNVSGNPPQGELSFTDTLPAGLTLSGAAVSPQCGGTVTYSGSDTITFTGGSLSDGEASCSISTIVTSASSGTYTNGAGNISALSASLSNSVTDQVLTVNSIPVLDMELSPAAIGVGQPAALAFTITSAGSATNAAQFIESLPPGLSLASITLTNDNPSCSGAITRPGTSNPVIVGDTSFEFNGAVPKNTVCSFNVQVTGTNPATYTNSNLNIAYISNLSNGITASTLTIIAPVLSKSFGSGSINSGDSTTLTFTLANAAPSPAQAGMAFIDTLPAGLTLSGAAVSPQCGGTVSYIGTDTISFSGGTLNDGDASCTIVTDVTSSTAGVYVNGSGNLSGLSTGMINGVTDQTLVVTVALPSLTVLKSVFAESDPVNGTVNPYSIPGAVMRYEIQVSNFGAGAPDSASLIIADPIPSGTALQVSGTPAIFIDGSPTSDLSLTYGGLSDLADGVFFCAGANCDYVPTIGADNTDSAVTSLRIVPTGTMAAESGSGAPNFKIIFRVVVQ